VGDQEDSLVEAVRDGLSRLADPVKAPKMQAYMKSTMPYRGVPSAGVKAVCREVFGSHRLGSYEAWEAAALILWREASFREERYAAIALTGARFYRQHQSPRALPVYQEMITTGAWWDYVDEVAARRVGPMLLSHGDVIRPVVLSWSTSLDMWKRRTSIICQVVAREKTDLDLLYACIEPNLADKDFFVRKAIGWSLRAYAWIDPDEIVAFVARQGHRLSGLSRREALKNIDA
jgi:3-methyladenine DNA glycosylase AlkD